MKKKLEQPVEEQVQDQVEKEETKTKAVIVEENKPSLNIYTLNKGLEKPLDEIIEEERKNLYKYYTNITRRNNIIMFISVALFIAAFVFLFQNTTWGMIAGWCVVGLTVVGMVIYHILTRNQYPRMSKHYFNTFWTKTNDYTFESPKFTECYVDFSEKYQLADVAGDRVYKDIIDIASRNLVHGKFEGKEFTFGELAFYKPGARKHSREVIFVGRHIALENKLALAEGRFLVNLRAEKELDLPNDIDDMVELIRDGNFVVYGLEGSDAVKALGKDLLDSLRRIKVVDALVNVNIIFWSGRTSVYLSYDDSIVAIPFKESFNMEAYKQLKRNVEDIFDIVAGL